MVARSFTFRALVALSMLILFYGFGLAVGLGLVAGGLAMLFNGRVVALKLALVMVVAGGTVLWSLIPRFAKWVDPGPRLDEREQPRLFAFIRRIAEEMGQPMPSEVYLIPDVNAFVATRGGFLGFGSTRVMGVGLGLLGVDNVSQVRATIAHEFGHFVGSDTRLGGVTWATRSAMIRTVQSLEGGFLSAPFRWLFKLYLRVTQAISRQQELVADEWSVRLAGKTAHVTGLQQEALHGFSFSLFMQNEVRPLLERGAAPKNVFEGFRLFAKSSGYTKVEPEVRRLLAESKGDPYDSHPALEARIAWAQGLSYDDLPMDEAPGISLLDAPERYETNISSAWSEGRRLIEWGEAGQVLGVDAEPMAARLQVRVPDLDVQGAYGVLADASRRDAVAEAFDPRLVKWRMADREETVNGVLVTALGSWLGKLLTARGFEWRSSPGEPLALVRGDLAVPVLRDVRDVLEGKAPPEDFIARLDALGLPRDGRLHDVTAAQRDEASAARAEVQLEYKGRSAMLVAPFEPIFLPRCCAVCMGPADELVTTKFTIGGFIKKSDQSAEMVVPLCHQHRGQGAKAFSVRKLERAGSWHRVTLEVPDPEYAELIRTVNG